MPPVSGQTSTSHGYCAGGASSDVIDKYSNSSDAAASDVGNLSTSNGYRAGSSSRTYGYVSGGYPPIGRNEINKWAFASDGDATDIGNLATGVHAGAGCHV